MLADLRVGYSWLPRPGRIMSDEFGTGRTETPQDTTPHGRKVLGWMIGVPVAIVALLLVMHVLIRPIPPTQKAPERHAGQPCWLCHMVSEGADPVELEHE